MAFSEQFFGSTWAPIFFGAGGGGGSTAFLRYYYDVYAGNG